MTRHGTLPDKRQTRDGENGAERFPDDLVERLLGTPVQTCEIRIFSLGMGTTVGFLRLALDAAGFLLALLHLLRFFAVAFGECCLGRLSDGVLLFRYGCRSVHKTGVIVEEKNYDMRSFPVGTRPASKEGKI